MPFQGSNGFRTHAGRIVTVINAAIEALDNENYVQELETIWNKIGETHEKRKISQQAFHVRYFAIHLLCLANNQNIFQHFRIEILEMSIF